MEPAQIVVMIIIGGAAGWLAGRIMKGAGFGVIGNVIVGIIGAVVGGWIFNVAGIAVGGKWIGPLVTATVGAIVLLFGISLIKKG